MLYMLTRDDPILRRAFAEALYELRTHRKPKLSQEALAEEAGLSRPYLGGLERGLHEPGLLTLWRLKLALKVSLQEFARTIERHYSPKPR